MVEIKIEKVLLTDIKSNPDNPRTISQADLDRLSKSLQDFPEMMELREVVVDEGMTILGGNMRFRSLQQIGATECIAKIVTGLTDEQKREFIIKDNGENWGSWDFDALSAWDDLPLVDWGIKMNKFETDDPEKEWEGMPEFDQEDEGVYQTIHVHFATDKDVQDFARLMNQTLTEKTKSIWFPESKREDLTKYKCEDES